MIEEFHDMRNMKIVRELIPEVNDQNRLQTFLSTKKEEFIFNIGKKMK
jgi:hypothetical protein